MSFAQRNKSYLLHCRYRLGQAGMGMVDVLAGMLLVLVGILGLASLSVSSIRANLASRLADQATRLGQQKLEEIRKGGYAGITSTAPVTESNLDYSGRVQSAGASAGGIFTRSTTFAKGALPLTYSVTVTVSWADPVARSLSFSLLIQGASPGAS